MRGSRVKWIKREILRLNKRAPQKVEYERVPAQVRVLRRSRHLAEIPTLKSLAVRFHRLIKRLGEELAKERMRKETRVKTVTLLAPQGRSEWRRVKRYWRLTGEILTPEAPIG